MNAIEKKSFQERSSSTFYTLTPPPFHYHFLILCLNRKLVNFNFKWIWIYGLKPHLPPFSSQKNEMLIFGLRLTSDDRLAGRWTQPHPPPLSSHKMKCSFLEYIQLLMIGRAG